MRIIYFLGCRHIPIKCATVSANRLGGDDMTDIDRAKQLATALNMSSGEWLDASSRALEPWATPEQRAQFAALARQRADMASELVELLER